MKKFLYTILILVAITAVFIGTCPNKRDHTDAIMEVVNSSLNDTKEGEADGWSLLGSVIGSKIISVILDQKLQVKNYFVCSVGQITIEGETKTLSIGLLNHVFTFDKDKLKDSFNKTNNNTE